MKTEKINTKFNKLIEKGSSKLLETIAWRERNEEWLDESFRIALLILKELRAKEMSQKDLADQMQVSPQYINKIVKGTENLTLDTICKIQRILKINILAGQQETLKEQQVFSSSQSVTLKSNPEVLKPFVSTHFTKVFDLRVDQNGLTQITKTKKSA
jgi:ribosome-binding protein aMBF1 (putative translation factor)